MNAFLRFHSKFYSDGGVGFQIEYNTNECSSSASGVCNSGAGQ